MNLLPGSNGSSPQEEALAARLRALAHPVRLRILAALAKGGACACGDIVRDLPLAQSTVSEHLRILREAGFVRGGTEGRRPCYCLDREAVRELAADFGRLFAAIGIEKDRPKDHEKERGKERDKEPVSRRLRKALEET
jgi:ArsR family transcriptional regulator, arsenate/arsenite/antimonite-responsive transcriptional repressor